MTQRCISDFVDAAQSTNVNTMPLWKPTAYMFFLAMVLIVKQGFAGDWGKVVVDHYECSAGASDRIVIATERGFTLAEVYSGYSATHEGKLIFGDLNSYGFTDFFDEDGDEAGRLYVEDYMASESTARDWCWG